MSNVATFNEFVAHVKQRMDEIGCERDVEIHAEMPWISWGSESFEFDAVAARRDGMRKQVGKAVARICIGHDD